MIIPPPYEDKQYCCLLDMIKGRVSLQILDYLIYINPCQKTNN